MSNKKSHASQRRHAKQNNRAKAKAKSYRKSKHNSDAVITNKIKAHGGALNAAVADVKANLKRGKVPAKVFKTDDDLIAGIKSQITESFKLFSFLTFAIQMVENKSFEYKFKIDMERIARDMIDLDSRSSRLEYLTDNDLHTEALDMGELVSAHTQSMFNEIDSMDAEIVEMEKALTVLAAHSGIEDPTAARISVLETFAYKFLSEVSLNIKSEKAEIATTDPIVPPAEQPQTV